MTVGGTAAYSRARQLPPLASAAVDRATAAGFDNSCAPEQGRLLSVLAHGRNGRRIGETGTGYGVGLAWMVSATDPATSFVSIDIDEARAAATTELFAAHPRVRILRGDWSQLAAHGPFDLLVLDGGGKGKDPADSPLDPTTGWLTIGGLIVLDDFTPADRPEAAAHDDARRHWLDHRR